MTEPPTNNSLHAWEQFYHQRGKEQAENSIDATGIIKLLAIQNTDFVLQLGCGTGDHIPGIIKTLQGVHAYGLEISETAIKLRTINKIVRADIRLLPFKNGTFTKLFAFGVVEHVPEIEHVLSEIARIVKPGAHIYLTVPNRISVFHIFKTFLMMLDRLHIRNKKFWKLGCEMSYSRSMFARLITREGFKILESEIIPSSDVDLRHPFKSISNLIHLSDYFLNSMNKNIFGFFVQIKALRVA
jgi:SAM-dependent methyltransferase